MYPTFQSHIGLIYTNTALSAKSALPDFNPTLVLFILTVLFSFSVVVSDFNPTLVLFIQIITTQTQFVLLFQSHIGLIYTFNFFWNICKLYHFNPTLVLFIRKNRSLYKYNRISFQSHIGLIYTYIVF